MDETEGDLGVLGSKKGLGDLSKKGSTEVKHMFLGKDSTVNCFSTNKANGTEAPDVCSKI